MAGGLLNEVHSHDERAESFRVPAGRYRITALGTERFIAGLRGRQQPRELGRASVVVEATAGAELDVPLRLAQGGHLRVDVRGSLTAAEVAAEERVIEESMEQLEVDRSTVLHIMGAPHHSLTLHLESLDGGPIEEVLHFVDPVPGLLVTGGSGSIVDRWSIGERDESFVLSSGRFLLRGTFPGRPDVVVPVEIRAGEVTDVTLVLGP